MPTNCANAAPLEFLVLSRSTPSTQRTLQPYAARTAQRPSSPLRPGSALAHSAAGGLFLLESHTRHWDAGRGWLGQCALADESAGQGVLLEPSPAASVKRKLKNAQALARRNCRARWARAQISNLLLTDRTRASIFGSGTRVSHRNDWEGRSWTACGPPHRTELRCPTVALRLFSRVNRAPPHPLLEKVLQYVRRSQRSAR